MHESTEYVGRSTSPTIGSEAADLSTSTNPATHGMPRRRQRPDHGITIGVAIAGPRTAGSHVPLCLCGFAGGEHVERRDAADEGRAHVEAEQPIPYTLLAAGSRLEFRVTS